MRKIETNVKKKQTINIKNKKGHRDQWAIEHCGCSGPWRLGGKPL